MSAAGGLYELCDKDDERGGWPQSATRRLGDARACRVGLDVGVDDLQENGHCCGEARQRIRSKHLPVQAALLQIIAES